MTTTILLSLMLLLTACSTPSYTGHPKIEEFTARVIPGSQVQFTWAVSGHGPFTFELSQLDADGDVIPGTASELNGAAFTMRLPASPSFRLQASQPDGRSGSADLVVSNVVTTGDDSPRREIEPLPGSLRAVLHKAEPGSVIGFAEGITDVLLSAVELINPHDAYLMLENDITISGPDSETGEDRVLIRGNKEQNYSSQSRLIMIWNRHGEHPVVTLENLRLADGDFIGRGGAIRNDGKLIIRNSEILNNTAWLTGGGIYNAPGAQLTIEGSVLRNNKARVEDHQFGVNYCVGMRGSVQGGDCDAALYGSGSIASGGWGGALYNDGGTVVMADSEVTGNQAVYYGGGIINASSSGRIGHFSGTGLTVHTNKVSFARLAHPNGNAPGYGGGISNGGDMTLTSSVIEHNAALEFGGGLINQRAASLILDRVSFKGNILESRGHGVWGGGLFSYGEAALDSRGEVTFKGNTEPEQHGQQITQQGNFGISFFHDAESPPQHGSHRMGR